MKNNIIKIWASIGSISELDIYEYDHFTKKNTACKKVNNIPATKIQMEKTTYGSQQVENNKWIEFKTIMISQSEEVTTLCKAAKNIKAIIFKMISIKRI